MNHQPAHPQQPDCNPSAATKDEPDMGREHTHWQKPAFAMGNEHAHWHEPHSDRGGASTPIDLNPISTNQRQRTNNTLRIRTKIVGRRRPDGETRTRTNPLLHPCSPSHLALAPHLAYVHPRIIKNFGHQTQRRAKWDEEF